MIRFIAAAVVLGLVANAFLGADNFGPTEPPRPIARPAPAVFEPERPIERPGRLNAAAVSSPRTLTIASNHGGFLVKCSADGGEWQHCIADTGAAHPPALLVLDRSAARAAGIDLRRLRYDGRASTANGDVHTAQAYVSRLQIGPFIVRNAPVVVNDGDIGDPLITTAFLRHFRVTISADTMTISEAADDGGR
jgi:clan AA aspartic protease (TIGR02281 family)